MKACISKLTWLILIFMGSFSFACVFHSGNSFAKPLEIGILLWRGPTDADQTFLKDIKKAYPGTVFYQENVDQNIRKTVTVLQEQWKDKLKQLDYLFIFGSRNSLKARQLLMDSDFNGTLISLSNSSLMLDAFKNRNSSGEKLLLMQTYLDPKVFLQTFADLLEMQSVIIPFNLQEPQNASFIERLQNESSGYKVAIKPMRTKPDIAILRQQLKNALDDVKDSDVFFFSWDSFLLSKAKFLSVFMKQHKILSVGSHKTYVKAGIPLGIDSDYIELGHKMAQQVITLEKGVDILALPVVRNTKGRLLANRESLKSIAPKLLSKLPAETVFLE